MLVDRYDIVDPVVVAREVVAPSLASELGPQGIRVHCVPTGPGMLRASSSIEPFDELLAHAVQRAPQHRLVTIYAVVGVVAGLVSDWARGMTGNVVLVDGSGHNVG